MPVLVVKSFESSTRALAGSQAAQHNVNCLVWATAWLPRHEATTAAVTPNARTVWIITTSLMSQAIACLPLPILAVGDRERGMFSILFSFILSLNNRDVNGRCDIFSDPSCCCSAAANASPRA